MVSNQRLPCPRLLYKRLTQISFLASALYFCYALLSLRGVPVDRSDEQIDDPRLDNFNIVVRAKTSENSLLREVVVPTTIGRDSLNPLTDPPPQTRKIEKKHTSKKPTASTKRTRAESTSRSASTSGGPSETSRSCPHYSIPKEVRVTHRIWQEFNATICSNCSFHFFNAYFDEREKVGPTPMLRVLMTSNIRNPPPLDCLLWYKNLKEPVRSRGSYVHIWIDPWGNLKNITEPYILSCPARESRKYWYPEFVSVVEDNCEQPVNVLSIGHDRPEVKQGFAVCVKGLFYPNNDRSTRLVEWFETLFLLGAHKIFLYEHAVHPNISRVLKYYTGRGLVEVTPFSFPIGDGFPPVDITGVAGSIIQQKRKLEMIPFNDCLYRNLYTHDYIAVLDADEVIVPNQDDNWPLMMARLSNTSRYHGFRFRNAYFMDDMTVRGVDKDVDRIPDYQHMLKHVYRARNISEPGIFVKSITPTDDALVIHNHFPIKCLTKNLVCNTKEVDLSIGKMHHYRKGCTHDISNCDAYFAHKVRDTSLWKYKKALLRNTAEVLRTLRLIE